MGYVSSTAPLPQNSLDPPSQSEQAASYHRLFRDHQASRTGRERVYANIPTAEQLYPVSLGLAVNAAGILNASENGRESILIGVSGLPSISQPETLAQVQAAAPVVVPMDSSLGLPGATVMPATVSEAGYGTPVGGPSLGYPPPSSGSGNPGWGDSGPVGCGSNTPGSIWWLLGGLAAAGWALSKKGGR
jgi:hypothetical protein